MNAALSTTPRALRYLTSGALAAVGVPHFFSMKPAGDMAHAGAASQLVSEIAPERSLVLRCQVHGSAVAVVGSRDAGSAHEADALVTDDPGTMVAIRTADCVSVLIASDDGHVVAAVHAGWRGVVAGVVLRAIECVRERSDRPLVAAIGPCISQGAFEVGPEVVAEFRRVFGAETDLFVRSGRADRLHIDLVESLRRQVRPFAVEVDTSAAFCTVSDSERFHSFRRDAAMAGRMLSGIGVCATAE